MKRRRDWKIRVCYLNISFLIFGLGEFFLEEQASNSIVMSKDIRNILLLTFIAIAIWIGFGLLHAATKTEVPGVNAEQLRLLEPRLDLEMLKILREAK